MVAGPELEPGQVLILTTVERTGSVPGPSFDSLRGFEDWVEANPHETVVRTQYFQRTDSGRECADAWHSHPSAVDAAQKNPKGFFDLFGQGVNVLEGTASAFIDDDGRTLTVHIANVADPARRLREIIDGYDPMEHGQPLRKERPGDLVAGPDGKTEMIGGDGTRIKLDE